MTASSGLANSRGILASDLDGTLIPLDADRQNRHDLGVLAEQLADCEITLIYVTGRHLQSVQQALQQVPLPVPDWVICDVGTSLFRRDEGDFVPVKAYQRVLDEIIADRPISQLREDLQPIAGLRPQEQAKQGRFKLSFYADATQLDRLVGRIHQELERTNAPYSIIHSVDPFTGDGLIDLLPATVSKAHALAWWVEHARLSPDSLVFAGDSGNDLAAMTAGYRTIVVGNADRSLAEQVSAKHREAGWQNRLCLARGRATSGVLEGCRAFGLL
jgi:HAD superfamily hydrolase (TIGR01484 family)